MQYSPVYYKTMDAIAATDRFVSSRGSARSGKTFTNLQCIYQLALADEVPTISSVVSETFPHLKRGAMRDFQTALGDAWRDSCWSKSNSVYELENGSIIEFFSADSPAKVHGPQRDRLFLNEIQNMDYDTARQLFIRTSGLIIMDYNPTTSFWGNEIIEARKDCKLVTSTYLDNPFLSQIQVAEIESNKGDSNWWKVYGLGQFGSLDGLIYTFQQIDKMPEPAGMIELYGLDFGFTNDPTAIVHVLVHTGRKEIYAEELCYRTQMLNSNIIDELKLQNVARNAFIYADCAEPKSITEIHNAGFNIDSSDKSAPTKDKIAFQVQWMQGWKLFFTKASTNLIKEARNYVWAKDRSGNKMNIPAGGFDHALDALRYACYTHLAKNPGYGQYAIRILPKR